MKKIVLILLITILFSSGCLSEEKLLGTWKSGEKSITFNLGGTGNAKLETEETTQEACFNFKVLDETSLEFQGCATESNPNPEKKIINYTIENENTLIIQGEKYTKK